MSEALRQRREAREAARAEEAAARARGESPQSFLSRYSVHLQALFLAVGTTYFGVRYSWGFIEQPPLDGRALLREPVPALAQRSVESVHGNDDCWDEDFNYARCCDLSRGPEGDRACWKGADFGYGDCCDVADRVLKAQHIMQAGEKYFQSARWLVKPAARRRHFEDALSAFELAQSFDSLGEELQWMIAETQRVLAQHDPQAPPPPPRKAPKQARRSGSAEPPPDLPQRPPHEVLGVAEDASKAEIRSAYRKLSRELHPDRHGGDPVMEMRFMEVTQAHEKMTEERFGED